MSRSHWQASERDLVEAMTGLLGGRIANPSDRPWTLELQAPEQEQPWRLVDRYALRQAALADATVRREPPGTVARVMKGGRLGWLGVANDAGEVVRAPSLPRAPDDRRFAGAGSYRPDLVWAVVARGGGVSDWLQAWEGPRAEAPWMLRAGDRVPSWLLVLAACACARRGALALGPGAWRTADAVLSLAEQAPSARGPDAADLLQRLRAATQVCYRAHEDSARGTSRREGFYAVSNAGFAAQNFLSGGGGDSIADQAMNAAAAAAWALALGRDDETLSGGPLPVEVVEQRRELAGDVRRFVSLGMVLRSLLV